MTKPSTAYDQGRFEQLVALLELFYKTVENDVRGGLLLAIALQRTARGDLAHRLSDRFLSNRRAGLELLQPRVLVQYSKANVALVHRALKAILLYAPGDRGGVIKEAIRVIHDSEAGAVNWFKRAYCLGANDSEVVRMLVEHFIKDATTTEACTTIIDQVDETFSVLWLRNVSKASLLSTFRNHCPPPES